MAGTTRQSLKHPLRDGRLRFSAAHLLVAIAAMFVVLPFVDEWRNGNLVESIIFSLVMLAGINALGGTWRTQMVAAALAIPALFGRWINHFWPGLLPPEFATIISLVFVTVVIAHLLRFVAHAPYVNSEVLCSAVAGYLLVALFWANAYALLDRWQVGAFDYSDPLAADSKLSGFLALYFSVQVLTTITFGDVTPATNVARMMTLVEATSGVLYLAILVARLVGIYSSGPRTDD